MYLISLLYQLLVKSRNTLYRIGFFKSKKPDGTFIVSVGNVAVGGTGKTPLVIKLIEDLNVDKVALLSRGYRRPKNPRANTWEEVGDEPYLIKKRLPHVALFIDSNRYRASKKALDEGYRLQIMDDGMQHRALKRDIEICLLDGSKYFLPYGRLRDDPKRVEYADLVVGRDVQSVIECVGIFDLENQRIGVKGPVALFSAIGKPKKFEETVISCGIGVIDHLILPDHRPIKVSDLQKFTKECQSRGANAILTTEKDAIKLEKGTELSIPLGWVKINVTIKEGQHKWSSLIERIQNEAMG